MPLRLIAGLAKPSPIAFSADMSTEISIFDKIPDLPAPDVLAATITRQSASNLWFVGRALVSEKRKLFEAAYATMRVIDDFVDDDFLARSPAERTKTKHCAQDRIVAWLKASEAAISGQPETEGISALEAQLFRALRASASGSDIPLDPWRNLAAAMRFDVDETPLDTWRDFEVYCEGATVAPAAVFLYVLQAKIGQGRAAKAGISADTLADQARDMAIFCYLVHILRDFSKDFARGGQLVTIPQACFSEHGLTRSQLSNDPMAAIPLLRDLADRAAVHRISARAMADRLKTKLGGVEARILESLLSIYEHLHDSLLQDPSPMTDRTALTTR
ncbi:MAG: squalene/phytoene synthase family protein, partial [Alphaproteobacteria bacterium]|nr:squalene/phytoene synthase family protein [Alphaproteobacteria bacterium]